MRHSHNRTGQQATDNPATGDPLGAGTNSEREAGARFRSLIANLPGLVFQWRRGRDGKVCLLFVSDEASAATGMTADAIMDNPRRLLRCIPRQDRIRLIGSLRRSIRTMEPVTEDFVIDRGARGTCWLRVTSRPRAGGTDGIISDALALDITDCKVAESTLQRNRSDLNDKLLELHRTKARLESQSGILMETARQLTEARDSAEQASRAKSDFLSNMSHELRTPLNAIIGFSQMIREQTFGPVGSPKYRDYASNIHESGLHLLELINDVLDFAKIEAGQEQLRDEAVDVGEIADSVLRMIEERAIRAEVTVEKQFPDPLPLVMADRRKIRQILLNLLSNAIKFTDRGGSVTMSAWASEKSGFVMQVTDTGIGIALADIPKALGLFGQIDSAFNRRHDGTGLGLPLSKSLVELHGGSLDLQSQPGVGTTVTVRLPAERIVHEEPPTITARTG